jgi:hypothetical protein
VNEMIDYGRQRSTVKPEPMVIDESSVWVHSNIQPVEETVGEEMFSGWEFNMIQYTKDEYIRMLDTQLTDTQLALVEVYELIIP